MAASIIFAAGTGGTLVGASTTTYVAGASTTVGPLSESLHRVRWEAPGTFSKLTVTVATNDRGASTVRFRKNSANGNGLVSIGASLTGAFQDASNSDSIVAGDFVSYQVATGAGGTVFRLVSIGASFLATSNTVARFQSTRDGGFKSGAGSYGLTADSGGGGVQDDTKVGTAGSFQRLCAAIGFNNRSGVTSLSTAVNGSASALAVSIPASTTGTFLDNSNSAAAVSGDLARTVWTSGTSGSIEIDTVSVDFETTGDVTIFNCHGQPSAVTATRYATPCGYLGAIHLTSTEADSSVAVPDAGTVGAPSTYLAGNTSGSSSTLTLRKNGVDTSSVVSIPASTTGWFTGTGSAAFVALDLMSVKADVGGSLTFRDISFGWTAPASNTPPVADAGPDNSVVINQQVALAGSGTDADLDSLAYLWEQVSGPGTATFVDDTDPLTLVSFDVVGSYVLKLTVDDGTATDDDTMTMTVVIPPLLVNAGPDVTITLPATLTLCGSHSYGTTP